MEFKIGFATEITENTANEQENNLVENQHTVKPRKSLVQVAFSGRGNTLAYYNDKFDLQVGDIVYVDGKLEGIRGRVVAVNYNFKIRISDYKRVIGLADTDIHGKFYNAGSHFVSFEPRVLAKNRVLTWYKAPNEFDEEYVFGSDDSVVILDDLKTMNIDPIIAERGHEYYVENRVKYICIDGNNGYAIVMGNKPYEVEFKYKNGEISELVCSCFCSYNCKHEFAALLQLKNTLGIIEKQYAKQFEQSKYFAAIEKAEFFGVVIENSKESEFSV